MSRSVLKPAARSVITLQSACLLVAAGGLAAILVYDVSQQRNTGRQAELTGAAQVEAPPVDHIRPR